MMRQQSFKFKYKEYFEILLTLSITLMIQCSFVSCKHNKADAIAEKYTPDSVPSMISFNDTVVYSDSGRVKLIIETPEIIIFDKAKDPYTIFPNKAYMEEYDSLMVVKTKLWADTIWNYNRKKLWKFKGNVRIEKDDGKIYESDELYWDESKDKIYSNKPVMIHEPNKATIRASKFESNQNMTDRIFFGTRDGELYISDKSQQKEDEK